MYLNFSWYRVIAGDAVFRSNSTVTVGMVVTGLVYVDSCLMISRRSIPGSIYTALLCFGVASMFYTLFVRYLFHDVYENVWINTPLVTPLKHVPVAYE